MGELQVVERRPLTAQDSVASGDFDAIQRLATAMYQSGFFIHDGAGSREQGVAQALVKVLAGKEMGIAPITSMMSIHVIKGRMSMSGALIASRLQACGYSWTAAEHDATRCRLRIYGPNPEKPDMRAHLGDSEFTIEQAKKAGLVKKDSNWEKYPEDMLWWRAMSRAGRRYAPQLFLGGAVYLPEELGQQSREKDREEYADLRARKEAEAKAALAGDAVVVEAESDGPTPLTFGDFTTAQNKALYSYYGLGEYEKSDWCNEKLDENLRHWEDSKEALLSAAYDYLAPASKPDGQLFDTAPNGAAKG